MTKRNMLSRIGKFFDPIGVLAPVLLFPKLILREAWAHKLGWDQEVPEEIRQRYVECCKDLGMLREIQIPRYLREKTEIETRSIQLHAFADASSEAFAAVLFLRVEYQDGYVSLRLVSAKSRVAPIKKITIPRLELLACLITSRLTNNVMEALEESKIQNFYWTDSTTALAWIQRGNQWGTFVGNRVEEICKLTDPMQWRHVPGILNPADLPSRGCDPTKLLKSRWWEGPPWLKLEASTWPMGTKDCDEVAIRGEAKPTPIVNLLDVSERPWYLPVSDFHKNVRVMAWVRRFAFSRHTKKETLNLSLDELEQSEISIVKLEQERCIQRGSKFNFEVFRTEEGLLRVKSRVPGADEVPNNNDPILLPNKGLLAELVIVDTHRRNYHAGTQYVVCKIRERYWMPKARRTVQRIIRSCVICKRFSGKSYTAKTPQLPVNRTVASHAFETTGVDLAGPLYLKDGRKVWMVIFTCAVFRCVSLDITISPSTESFLETLERFVNTRGRPTTIYSDNGTNFRGTDNLFEKIDWDKVEERVQVKKIRWLFNPPSAAWWGGWWERLIRMIKDLLKRMLGKAILSYEQLRTHLSHAERVINERPLTTMSEDAGDLMPLTPAMFLSENPTHNFPEYSINPADKLRKLHIHRGRLREELSQRFQKEYLTMLFQRREEEGDPLPSIGDVVLIGSDFTNRLNWPMGRIVKTFPGKDGQIRVAQVKSQNGLLLRPIQRLFPMELAGPLPERSQIDLQVTPDAQHTGQKGSLKRGADAADIKVPNQCSTPPVRTRAGRETRCPRRFLD